MKRAVLIGVLVLLLGLGAYFGWRYYRDAYLPNREIEDALEAQQTLFAELKPAFAPPAAAAPDAPEAPTVSETPDPLAGLRAVNSDTVGWLTVEGTGIDYPIVQARDNEAYLRVGYDGAYNYVGTPFLDCRCAPDFGGVSVIYGHYIPGRPEMFADVIKYRQSAYLAEHPRGTLLTETGAREVRFFAYLTVPSDSFVYDLGIAQESAAAQENNPAAPGRGADNAAAQEAQNAAATEQGTQNAAKTAREAQNAAKTAREAYIDALYAAANYPPERSAAELKASDAPLLLLSTCSYEYDEARGVLVGVIE